MSKSPLKANRLNSRNQILGFKFHFLGRFSRKQRAASIWFKKGIIPLNTLKAHIEYGFHIIPLANSVVNVKVWICRNSEISDNLTMGLWYFNIV